MVKDWPLPAVFQPYFSPPPLPEGSDTYTSPYLDSIRKGWWKYGTGSKCDSKEISVVALITLWAGWHSRYSDWLRTGRSADQILAGGVRFSPPVQTGPGAHPASCTMGTGSFPGVKSGQGVTLTTHPLLVPWPWKGRAVTLLPPMGRTACTEPQCLYKGALYLTFYWSHYGCFPVLTFGNSVAHPDIICCVK